MQGVRTFLSHTSHIHDIAWHPTSEHHLITASIDKTLKLWDLRSTVPLHTLEGHTEQVQPCLTCISNSKSAFQRHVSHDSMSMAVAGRM